MERTSWGRVEVTFIFNHSEVLGSMRLEMGMLVKCRLLLFSHAEFHSEITCRMKKMEALMGCRGMKTVASGPARVEYVPWVSL